MRKHIMEKINLFMAEFNNLSRLQIVYVRFMNLHISLHSGKLSQVKGHAALDWVHQGIHWTNMAYFSLPSYN